MTYDPTPRDARGTGPSSRIWSIYAGIGLAIVAAIALVVLWTPMPESTHTVSATPPANAVQQ